MSCWLPLLFKYILRTLVRLCVKKYTFIKRCIGVEVKLDPGLTSPEHRGYLASLGGAGGSHHILKKGIHTPDFLCFFQMDLVVLAWG